MKHLRVTGLILLALWSVSCETTNQTAGEGNQERKRLAALQEARQQPQPDESDQNLWNAQRDRLNTGTNPAIRY